MLYCTLPWQHAERDPGYYARAVDLLNCPAWLNWQYRDVGAEGYVPMVWEARLGPEYSQAMQFMVDRKGEWTVVLLGNEPERPEQSDTPPQEYRDAVTTWQVLVGGQWAGPGVRWSDEGRAWLDEYLRLGGPIPDYWAIHIYGSADVDGWLDQYLHAVRWFKERNVSRPIWVTETNGSAALMRFLASEPSITAFWYAAYDPFGNNRAVDLTNADATALTPLGELYASLHGPEGTGEQAHRQYIPFIAG